MTIKPKKILLTLFLLLIVSLSCRLLYNAIFQKQALLQRAKSQPTAILYGVHSISYAEDGNIKTQLNSTQLTYYKGLDKTVFQNPIIISHNPKQGSWHITAKTGVALHQNSILKLIDDVHLHQQATKNNPESTITTSELTLYPQKHYGETNRPVTYTRISPDKSKVIVKSVGAKVYQKTGQVKLLSKARAVYEPNS